MKNCHSEIYSIIFFSVNFVGRINVSWKLSLTIDEFKLLKFAFFIFLIVFMMSGCFINPFIVDILWRLDV